MQKNAPLLVDIGQGLSMMIGLPTITTWDTKGRPKSPRRGTFGFNFETNSLEYWDGIQWFGALMGTL
jgi:hypothetical protein